MPGYKATDADQKAMRDIIHRLFDGPDAPGIFVADESQIADALAKDKKIRPDVQFSPPSPELGLSTEPPKAGPSISSPTPAISPKA